MTDRKDHDSDVKQVLGLPARWNARKMFKNVWNREDDRIFPPKQFGIGWDMNFHALLRELGLIKKR